jgi:hypothetical protein
MEPTYIFLVSILITGVVVYIVYYYTQNQKTSPPLKTAAKDPGFELEEDFLDDIGGEFKSEVYKKTHKSELIPESELKTITTPSKKVIKKYPECFGTVKKYSSCRRDCDVLDECTSTINILEGL